MDSHWTAEPVVDWMLEAGRLLPDVDQMVHELGQILVDAGAPLWRLRLSMRTLHPLITAFSAVWERDEKETEFIEATHGLEGRSGFVGSPLDIIGRTRVTFRRRLRDELTENDHRLLFELRSRGATDYLGIPIRFSRGEIASLVFITDRADGFADFDIDQFHRIASALAPIAEVFNTRRVSQSIAQAYLGARTGQLVLDGRITRGDVERINAAILMSDIRDWSGLNSRMPARDALALANAYFEIIAQSVEQQGGEILKFIGDAVLAVFAASECHLAQRSACESALLSARQALRAAATATPEIRSLRFGMGLHFGEVLYGNIGSKTRLDFTVLGQAVNITARIEGLCGDLGQSLLFSEEFADRLQGETVLVTRTRLKGHAGEHSILTVLEAP